MGIDWTQVAFQAINFAVLVWLLKRFLYAPVLDLLARRRREVEERLAAADAERARADAAVLAAEAERRAAARACDEAAEAARGRVEAELAGLREATRREADAALARGRDALAREREQAQDELRRAAARLGAAMAERLLQDAGAPDVLTPRLLERALTAVEHDEHLDELRREASAGGRVAVVTAAPLAPTARTTATERLARALAVDGQAVRFELDPGLVAGVEVRVDGLVVADHVRGALERIAREVAGDDHAG